MRRYILTYVDSGKACVITTSYDDLIGALAAAKALILASCGNLTEIEVFCISGPYLTVCPVGLVEAAFEVKETVYG